jgi:hypothetical protein
MPSFALFCFVLFCFVLFCFVLFCFVLFFYSMVDYLMVSRDIMCHLYWRHLLTTKHQNRMTFLLLTQYKLSKQRKKNILTQKNENMTFNYPV